MIPALSELLDALRERGELSKDEGVEEDDVDEDWEVSVNRGRNPKAGHLAGEQIFEAYVEEMDSGLLPLLAEVVRTIKEQEEKIERADITTETQALEELDKTEIDEIVGFFDGIISNSDLSLLREALYLQRAQKDPDISLSKNIEAYKRTMREDYGVVAYYMNHLVSSDYFNEGGFFQEMYHELDEYAGPTDKQYLEEFELILHQELLAVFVSEDDGVRDVKLDIRATLTKYFRYRPHSDFIDVRGIGDRCTFLIDRALADLEERYQRFEYEDRDRNSERVARIFPDSMRDIIVD